MHPPDWVSRPIAVVDLATGTLTEAGPISHDARTAFPSPDDSSAGVSEHFDFEWSPDGRSILARGSDTSGRQVLIDATSGTYRVLDAIGQTDVVDQAWQRTAP